MPERLPTSSESLWKRLFLQLSVSQIASVEAIAMDMSASYVKSAKQCLPLAEEKIVHDRFHVMKLATEGVRRESWRISKTGTSMVT